MLSAFFFFYSTISSKYFIITDLYVQEAGWEAPESC